MSRVIGELRCCLGPLLYRKSLLAESFLAVWGTSVLPESSSVTYH